MKKKLLIYISLSLLIIFVSNVSKCEKPELGAQSAILIDVHSKRVLASYNPHVKLPIASTTKIMTALVALEKGELTDDVKIHNNSVGVEGSSIYLEVGEIITLEDLLYGLLLRSGNDSAIAIGNHIGGDLDRFIYLMNEKAKKIGAKKTNFTNPHGLHDDNHYSTAYDLALITAEAMKMEKFKEIVSKKKWSANRSKNNIFYNNNKTLWEYEGGDGVKTGYTLRAGRCLVTSATRDSTQLIAVVLNDGNWFNDCYKLMDYGFENYNTYVLCEKQQFFKIIPIENGNKEFVTAISKESFLYPLREDELERVKVNISLPKLIEAPIHKDEKIGDITIYLDGKIIYKGQIVSKENVNKLNIFRKLIKKVKES